MLRVCMCVFGCVCLCVFVCVCVLLSPTEERTHQSPISLTSPRTSSRGCLLVDGMFWEGGPKSNICSGWGHLFFVALGVPDRGQCQQRR
eukprot:NODE_1879_length_821_cov_2.338083_g1482_i0.p2 GENE.NODE_1879_length_821_cov_2.338083_g1482_i0~~NODE_1879_length_821_cov_2.338083_g1482_i0.p2  ORF type:complete len:89 (-),score=14.18 NODE_1879_length_821_cov_2.338083_g1482_i0:217-483(-)